MCLIIASPFGDKSPDNYLANGYDNNPHGWGVMWCDGGIVKTAKGRELSSLRRVLARKVYPRGTPYAIHFRYATHGDHSTANLHPFYVGRGRYMMHNGIIPQTVYKHVRQDRSDTWHLAKQIKHTSGDILPLGDLEKAITPANKLCFLAPSGDMEFAHEKSGDWDGTLWLSNIYSIEPAYTYIPMTRKGGKAAKGDTTPWWVELDDDACKPWAGHFDADTPEVEEPKYSDYVDVDGLPLTDEEVERMEEEYYRSLAERRYRTAGGSQNG